MNINFLSYLFFLQRISILSETMSKFIKNKYFHFQIFLISRSKFKFRESKKPIFNCL